MKLTVKDVGGKKMFVEVEPSCKIGELKSKLQAEHKCAEPARQKLIHKGKVLTDDDTIEATGVTEAEFYVFMTTNAPKAKPAAVAAPAPAPTAATAAAPTAGATAATAATTAAAPPAAPSAAPAAVDPAQVEGLVSMGFAEAHVRAALEATGGNPDAAYTLLESGAPIQPPAPPATAGTAAAPGAPGAITSLEAFRALPQFDQLRRMVQSNPNAIEQVMAYIGQQNPQLLQVILEQQDDFIAMMNEPIAPGAGTGGTSAAAGAGQGQAQVNPFAGLGGAIGGMGGMEGMGGEGPSPQQLAQMLQSMPEAQRNQLLSQLVGLPLEQVQQFSGHLIQALASGAAPGMGGMGGGMGAGGVPPGAQRIELTAEEAANLNQLVEMGFERNEALQVFLACDKNLEMAASVLFQEAEAGGGMGGGMGGGSGGPGTGGGDSQGGDAPGSGGDQMY